MKATLYEALGILPTSSDEDVRAALRRLIRKYYAGTRDGQGNVEEALRFINHASRILSDANITDEERAKKFAQVQKQIVLMKSKTGQSGVKDPELDTETVKETKINPDGSQSETTRKQVRKPGGIEAKYPEPPQQAIDMLKADPKMAGNFDAIFGKGAAAAAMGSGSAKPTATTKPAAVAAPDAKIEYLRDGYRVNGVKYESIGEAQKASDRIKRGSNNGMSDMIEKFD